MQIYGKRLCFIGAHPDDIELGCGALIHQAAKYSDVLCVTLSDNQKNPLLTNLVEEHHNSMAVLGVPKENIRLESFTTRRFPEARQEILEYMLNIRNTYQPEIVFVHTKADIHQDHGTITGESLRAFRGTTVLGFDVVRSTHGFFPNFLVEVSEEDVNAKIAALSEYHTYRDKYYFNAELTRSICVRHGALAERPFAEGFDILRAVCAYHKEC